ncbi:MAG TPA: hypothetical protein VEP68_04415 [Anaeromyxobacteraceae bacterium]|nr:hypothetical protein [Anaeromyxobacteraceae bacterium]
MSRRDLARLGWWSALGMTAGVFLSGPLTVLAVAQVAPQPVEWQGIETYARAFHPLQLITFAFGFLTVLGAVGVVAALHQLAPPDRRFHGTVALVSVTAFAAVIGVNYMLQLAVLRPNLAAGRLEGMALLAFNNPDSVAMALEMLGYGFLGLATAFAAPLLEGRGVARWAAYLGVVNGVVSVAAAALQAAVGLRGLAGLAAYAAWNVLFAALSVLYVLHLGRVRREAGPPE